MLAGNIGLNGRVIQWAVSWETLTPALFQGEREKVNLCSVGGLTVEGAEFGVFGEDVDRRVPGQDEALIGVEEASA
jgi:hypothetical protein